MSSLQQAALSDTIWIFPTKRCLLQISLTILQDLKIPFGYQYAKHSTVLIWRTEDKQNREKQNKGDVSKISGKHSFATVTMCCLYSLNYPFFFFFNQCHLHLPKSFRRPKNSCRATVWQEESPIFIFSYFSRGTFSRHMETWVNKKKNSCEQEKKIPSWYHRQNVFHIEFLESEMVEITLFPEGRHPWFKWGKNHATGSVRLPVSLVTLMRWSQTHLPFQ